jgi:phosphoribosyl-AMP cyclohydrolase
MNSKKTIIIVFMLLFLFTATAENANANFFSNVRNYFAQRGKEAPEFECTVNINTETSEDCIKFSKEYKLNHTCQIYTKYDEKKGIKQCDFCVDKFLSKTNKKIPKTCLDVKIEGTHFTNQEIEEIITNNKNEIIKKESMSKEEVGKINNIKGEAYIIRNRRSNSAKIGNILLCGDSIKVENNSEVVIDIKSHGIIRITENIIFNISDCEEKKKSNISSFFNNMWQNIKEKLRR